MTLRILMALRRESSSALLACSIALSACSGGNSAPSSRGDSASNAGRLAAASVGGAAARAATAGSASSSIVPTSSAPTLATAGSVGSTSGSGPADATDPIAIDQCSGMNPAGLNPADTQRLQQGGPMPPRLLYPYDGTVFPRGMMPPTLMWDGAMTDAVYVHIQSKLFEWKGCVKPSGANQLELPADVWKAASARTMGTGDPYKVEVSTLSGGTVSGPASIAITIAQATLKGSIYYNSYISSASFSGTIFRIPPGGKAEVFLGGLACYGCHTVSANGERLISHTGGDPGLSYALTPMTQPNPPQLAAAPLPGFAGLSPDGSVYLASAHPAGAVRPQGTPNEAALVNDAMLYQTDTGAPVMNSGIPPGAMMPTFSPSGSMIAFNDFAIMQGKGLAVMDFDPKARVASGHRVVFTDTDRYPGWPFFLPDGKAVIFARGVNPQFSGSGAGVIPGSEAFAPESDLYVTDLKSGTTTILAAAMGLTSPDDKMGYVPFGAQDMHKHFYPTVSPVAAGGYFWVFFDSIRHYGNLGLQRQLWGTAISIAPDGDYSRDRSHPAFYLPGQELGTGNHRAFAALDACMKDGSSCKTGVDCCGGFFFIPPGAELGGPAGLSQPPIAPANATAAVRSQPSVGLRRFVAGCMGRFMAALA